MLAFYWLQLTKRRVIVSPRKLRVLDHIDSIAPPQCRRLTTGVLYTGSLLSWYCFLMYCFYCIVSIVLLSNVLFLLFCFLLYCLVLFEKESKQKSNVVCTCRAFAGPGCISKMTFLVPAADRSHDHEYPCVAARDTCMDIFWQVHEGCAARMSEAVCTLGRHRRLILPPIAVLKNQPPRRAKGELRGTCLFVF